MKKPEPRVIRSLWDTFPIIPIMTYHEELKRQLKGCASVLDIGCGGGSPLQYIAFKRAVGIDLDPEYIDRAKKNKSHHEYYQDNVLHIKKYFSAKEFDACVALDLIEHLTKQEGLTLIEDMAYLAKKKIIIFTPNGYMNQKNEEHPLQDHHSGWTATEMKKMGFTVYGMLGPKSLRSDQHVLKGNKYISGILSEIAQKLYIHNKPEQAAAILCVKEF